MKKPATYSSPAAELLLADYAARAGLRTEVMPLAVYDALVRELARLTARVGVLITEEKAGPGGVVGIYALSVARKGSSSPEKKASLQLYGNDILITGNDVLTKVDLFWNPFAGRFESRELDEAGRRTDALTVLARAVVEAIEKS